MSDTRTALLEIVRRVAPTSGVEGLSDFDQPLTVVGLDSLDMMSILLAVQGELSVAFSDEDVDEFETLGQMADEIDRRVGGV